MPDFFNGLLVVWFGLFCHLGQFQPMLSNFEPLLFVMRSNRFCGLLVTPDGILAVLIGSAHKELFRCFCFLRSTATIRPGGLEFGLPLYLSCGRQPQLGEFEELHSRRVRCCDAGAIHAFLSVFAIFGCCTHRALSPVLGGSAIRLSVTDA